MSIILILTNQLPVISQTDAYDHVLGAWYSENDAETKWVYNENGILQVFWDNVLKETYEYSISHSCGIEYDEKFFFIKWVDKDGREFCSEINGVNENDNGILSLTSMENGKVSREELAGPDD